MARVQGSKPKDVLCRLAPVWIIIQGTSLDEKNEASFRTIRLGLLDCVND